MRAFIRVEKEQQEVKTVSLEMARNNPKQPYLEDYGVCRDFSLE